MAFQIHSGKTERFYKFEQRTSNNLSLIQPHREENSPDTLAGISVLLVLSLMVVLVVVFDIPDTSASDTALSVLAALSVIDALAALAALSVLAVKSGEEVAKAASDNSGLC